MTANTIAEVIPMTNDQITELLRNFRSYEYAALNCGRSDLDQLPLVISERKRNKDVWDRSRYNRVVKIVRGAIEHVLSDDQRTVISRKYLERNTMTLNEISDILHKDRTTIGRWHSEAIRRLAIALEPLNEDELELTPFNHMFDHKGRFREPQETA
jgi:DNA-directed RNA polymerase specialized sigma subunit